jgi:probable phosphoglycerate mutase
MKVFLVRHGKSDAHEHSRRQSPNSPLGSIGQKQAIAVATRMKSENVDLILTSKFDRAHQTATAIAKAMKMELEVFEGIHEKEQNPLIYGARNEDQLIKRFVSEEAKNLHDLDWKFEGKGESSREVMQRALIFEQHLIEKHKGQNLVVVSHGHFIKSFVILTILGKDYSDEAFYKIYASISIANTGITLLEYIEDEKKWRLRYLNDHLHIGEIK